MAYSELIKNFENIRDYISQFYVYGFKRRKDYDKKSSRSYDNERRRIESWLGEYMCFTNESDGKSTFLSLDSRTVLHNPLYKAFKAKSFTDKNIMLHFYILDILKNKSLSSSEIADEITNEYFSMFESVKECDESTIRKKLNEYEKLGLIKSEKQGRKRIYSLNECDVDLDKWRDALSFFTEVNPIGVIGSYLLDKFDNEENPFRFKQHYIFNALESEVLYDLLDIMNGNCNAEIKLFSNNMKKIKTPISDEEISELQIGDKILLSGVMYTGRDAALPQLVELIKKGKTPINTNGIAIMHTAVSDAGIAPTTSNKEEIESTIPFLSENGVKIHIGKGMLNDETKKALNKNNSIFVITPPVAALLTNNVLEKECVAFENEGIEALYKLKVENIPGIVAIAHGKSI